MAEIESVNLRMGQQNLSNLNNKEKIDQKYPPPKLNRDWENGSNNKQMKIQQLYYWNPNPRINRVGWRNSGWELFKLGLKKEKKKKKTGEGGKGP